MVRRLCPVSHGPGEGVSLFGLVTRTHGRLRVRVSLCDLSHLPGARPTLAGVLEGATSAPRAPRAEGTRAGATHARGQSPEGPPGHRASPHPTALSRAPLAATCRRHLSTAAVVAEPLEDSHACCSGCVLHSVPLGGEACACARGQYRSPPPPRDRRSACQGGRRVRQNPPSLVSGNEGAPPVTCRLEGVG